MMSGDQGRQRMRWEPRWGSQERKMMRGSPGSQTMRRDPRRAYEGRAKAGKMMSGIPEVSPEKESQMRGR